jgi:hypothetical protein
MVRSQHFQLQRVMSTNKSLTTVVPKGMDAAIKRTNLRSYERWFAVFSARMLKESLAWLPCTCGCVPFGLPRLHTQSPDAPFMAKNLAPDLPLTVHKFLLWRSHW